MERERPTTHPGSGWHRAGRARVQARLAAGCALVALLAAGCGSEDRVVPRPTPSTELPSQEVRDFSLEESDTGTPEWILRSGYAATYDARGVIVARGVAIDFFDSKGVKYSHLTAKEGEIKRPSNDMEARGNVVVTTTDGVRIQTESLRFLNHERKIVSDEFVRLERNGDVVTGIGFESDPSLEHFAIKREVRAQVQSSPNGGLRFRQRGAP
ncbi:MAG: LPS export ABC transporter periplasmic protein LptC [Candidatus Eisenbacteria bacterium]